MDRRVNDAADPAEHAPERIREGIRILGDFAARACTRAGHARPASRGEVAPLV